MENNMFCFQCQETAKGFGCTLKGVCGKNATTARTMDLLLFVVRGISVVGILAKLELSEEEKEAAKSDMEQMLDYIDSLNELDTTGIEPMSHVFPVQNVFREDVVTNGDNKEKTLANAPLRKEDSFEVPKTIG